MFRRAVLGIVCAALVVIGVPADVADIEPAAAYLDRAKELIVANAYYAHRLRTDEMDEIIDRSASGSDTPSDTYAAIELLVSMLGDRHSQFLRPDALRELEHRSEAQLDEPFGIRVLSDVAYLRVPPILTLEADNERARAYAEAAWSALAQNRDACAWIVDLRGNFGGSLPPMIAAIAPLLGRGRAVGYTTRDGATTWYAVGEDRITIDDTLVQRFDGPLSPLAGHRLAVLTDGFTASSGEGVLIALLRKGATSFGAPTAGVPTGNAGFAMPDGAVLLLTTSLGTGAHGELFDGAIEPMKPMAPGTGRHDDAIIDAAATSIDGCET